VDCCSRTPYGALGTWLEEELNTSYLRSGPKSCTNRYLGMLIFKPLRPNPTHRGQNQFYFLRQQGFHHHIQHLEPRHQLLDINRQHQDSHPLSIGRTTITANYLNYPLEHATQHLYLY
jgi:hypothetical protein